MAGMWQRAMEFLGLSDDDSYGTHESYEDQSPPPAGRRSVPPSQPEVEPVSVVRSAPSGGFDGGVGSVSPQPRGPSVRTVTAVPQTQRVHTTNPTEFSDCQEIGERFRSGQPVIVNLGEIDRELTRRIVDFASGLVYGLSGKMQKVADKVYLLTPSNIEVSADEKRRLQERGLYPA